MKRSSQLKLGLVGAIPFALTACSPQAPNRPETVSGTLKKTYESVQSCVDDKLPVDICSDAFMAAMAEHRRIAPAYGTKADCEADFVEGYCAEASNGQFMPKLGGFEIVADYNLPASQAAALSSPAGSSASGGGNDGFLSGLLLGQLLSDGGTRYYSEPIYISRDSRGQFYRSTLSRQIEMGKTFQRSSQVASGVSYTSQQKASITSSLKRPTTINTKPVSLSSSSSRSGFGSQAAARSGWGSSGGGRSSFGG